MNYFRVHRFKSGRNKSKDTHWSRRKDNTAATATEIMFSSLDAKIYLTNLDWFIFDSMNIIDYEVQITCKAGIKIKICKVTSTRVQTWRSCKKLLAAQIISENSIAHKRKLRI